MRPEAHCGGQQSAGLEITLRKSRESQEKMYDTAFYSARPKALLPAAERLDAAYADVLQAHAYDQWRRYDAKLAHRAARDAYEAAVRDFFARRADAGDIEFPDLCTFHDKVVRPLEAEWQRLRDLKHEAKPSEEIWAKRAWAAATNDYDDIKARHETKYAKPRTWTRRRKVVDGVMRTGKTTFIDGIRVPIVEEVPRND